MTPGKELSTPAEILQVALKKEQNALMFYNRILAGARVDFIRILIEQLRDEEAKHVKMIERKITSLKTGKG
jgi:rubrerythrin